MGGGEEVEGGARVGRGDGGEGRSGVGMGGRGGAGRAGLEGEGMWRCRSTCRVGGMGEVVNLGGWVQVCVREGERAHFCYILLYCCINL